MKGLGGGGGGGGGVGGSNYCAINFDDFSYRIQYV